MLYHWLISYFIILTSTGSSHTYYVSPSGKDNNNGLSSQTPWKSLEKINSIDLKPGDLILFEGGKTFQGNISLDSLDSGLPGKPIGLSSYGKGYAIIYSSQKDGLYGYNCSYVNVSNLVFKGNGVGNNNNSGIHFYSDSKIRSSKVKLSNCRAEGFNLYGIVFGAGDADGVRGYDSVRIENCIATRNGEAGISSYGSQNRFSHTNFYINKCKAFLNKGNPRNTEHHSGNGIVMSSIENLLIEHCEAYENGSDNRCTAGGPVGIWVWICKKAVIQYCESHHNRAGLTKDGGGFDIDGGSSDCIIQYNYSHDNEGAGYLLAEYGAGLPFTNNVVRFNFSRNDGRKNSYGAVSIWGADTNYRVLNSQVYNNSFFVDTTNVVNGIPCAVQAIGTNMKRILITNNIFNIGQGARLFYSTEGADTSNLQLLSNQIKISGQPKITWNEKTYVSLRDWKLMFKGQETGNGKPANLSSMGINKGNYDIKGKNIEHSAKDFFGAEMK